MEQTGIGIVIRNFRINRGMSVSQLGKESGTSKGLISELENQKRNDLQISTLGKIAKAMSTPASAMLKKLEEQEKV